MNDQNYSNAFLEWQENYFTRLKNRDNPFSPEANVYYYDIEDHNEVKEV